MNPEELSLYFEEKEPDIPLEDNPEFRSIQSVIIKSTVMATRIIQTEVIENFNIATEIQSLIRALCNLIVKDYNRKLERLNNQIDSKLRSKIEQKKAANGLKTERGIQ